MIRKRNGRFLIDYDLADGTRRIIRYVPSQWQNAQRCAFFDWDEGHVDADTAGLAMLAIQREHDARRKSWLELLAERMFGVPEDSCENGRTGK
jgi:hypothetical protein